MARREQTGGRQAMDAPYVDPSVGQVAAYRAGLQARRAALPKVQTPVAGGPTPAIPHLNAPHQEGLTMQQQGDYARRAREAASAMHTLDQGGIVERPIQQSSGPVSPAQMGILPTDVLPEQATKDPAFMQGQGAMYAAAQPQLARKYGVIRNGNFIPPQKLQEQAAGGMKLRPETMQDIETLRKLQGQQRGEQPVGSLYSNEDEASLPEDSPARAAGRVGNVIGDDDTKPLTEDDKKRLEQKLSEADEFDFDTFRQAMMRDLLNNPTQQKIIEARLKPLEIDELIVNNRVTQRVPIIPGRFEPTFQSITGEEDLAIKRLIMEESQSVEVTDRYMLDKYSFMTITVGLVAINGKPFGGDVTDSTGKFDEENFKKKFNRVIKLPLHMLASIGLNLMWFEMRVRKLFVAEKVGNG